MSIDLRQARINSGYTIEQVADHLKIRKKYLLAIEESKYELLPGSAYVIGYLNSYHKFLNIKVEDVQAVDLQTRITKFDNEDKNLKSKKYLIIISIIMLVIISIIYYQFFYNEKYEDVITTYPSSDQNNLDDEYGNSK